MFHLNISPNKNTSTEQNKSKSDIPNATSSVENHKKHNTSQNSKQFYFKQLFQRFITF